MTDSPGHDVITSSVKLVIWDLDETFWKGTISEDEIEWNEAHAEIVRSLNRRGIVNSICSKNDFDSVADRLRDHGMWGEFVFPSIDWTPKGPRIAKLIEEMGLRNVNVLFVDDNAMNLNESKFYAPGIQTIDPAQLTQVLNSPHLAGKDDTALSRLEQYRVLEKKRKDMNSHEGGNEQFLRESGIVVEICDDVESHVDRLRELVNRSNQLNFTKTRYTESEMQSLISNEGVSTGYIKVRDNYGDYGICGFFAHDDMHILNLTFSCRILNMGVEQWVYQQLGSLPIEVVGEVSSSLTKPAKIDWINTSTSSPRGLHDGIRDSAFVVFKGGCDLQAVSDQLGGNIATEFSYTAENGALIHQEHSEILKRAHATTLAEFGSVIDRLPFLDRAAYETGIFNLAQQPDVVVYSILMDYTQGLYQYRDTDFVVPYGDFLVDVTDERNFAHYETRLGHLGFDKEFLNWFADNFSFLGALKPQDFTGNIVQLREKLGDSTQLILINGAEVALPSVHEPNRQEWHKTLNKALDALIPELSNTELCDVRKFVISPEDVTNNIRHYSRKSYILIAKELSRLIGERDLRRQNPLLARVKFAYSDSRRLAYKVLGPAYRKLRRK